MPSTTPSQARSLVEERLFSPSKKRILTLDGGGVRGIVSIAFLAEMEEQLREQTGRKDLVLSDVFDMIAGTSVGSMLATMLALGKEADEIRAAFQDLAPKIFKGRLTPLGLKRYDAGPLAEGVRAIVEDETLGSTKLKTGLCIVAKRVDTGSPWLLSNNPRMPYYHDGADFTGNKHYKLESLIRASTAAPFLFEPTAIEINTDDKGVAVKGLFVDGGVSPHNNPALEMLLQAGLPSYKLNWTLSPDDLLMISIGTGQFRARLGPREPLLSGWKSWLVRRIDRNILSDVEEAAFAAKTLRGVVADSALYVLKVMQALSHPRFSWYINAEIEGLEGEVLLAAMKRDDAVANRGLLRFQRYDLPLEMGLVPPHLDVKATKAKRMEFFEMDDPSKIDELYRLASEAAAKQVSMADFAGFVDVPAKVMA